MNREEFRSNRREHSAGSDFVGEPDRNEDRPEATNGQLTAAEKLLLAINAVVWDGFNALNQLRDGAYYNDLMDMRQHIDGINNIILARASARANPDLVRRG